MCKQKQNGRREIHKCFLYRVIWTITSNYPNNYYTSMFKDTCHTQHAMFIVFWRLKMQMNITQVVFVGYPRFVVFVGYVLEKFTIFWNAYILLIVSGRCARKRFQLSLWNMSCTNTLMLCTLLISFRQWQVINLLITIIAGKLGYFCTCVVLPYRTEFCTATQNVVSICQHNFIKNVNITILFSRIIHVCICVYFVYKIVNCLIVQLRILSECGASCLPR